MLSFLPAALFALLFAWPGSARGISSNDPFRAIALTVPQPEPPPICCLNASEPLDDEVLLSFEDWKKKQAAQQREKQTDGTNQSSTVGNELNVSDTGARIVVVPPNSNLSTDYGSGILQPSDVSPHFRVPITDRFNYANMDCSARVHTSHRSAKSPSSILSSKKDRYMLSPCNSRKEKQFVVVELCDDIRIDTVQLANFEFFSGVFKDFAVSVAKTYSTDPDGWLPGGTYRAKNVRGVQSFHPPTSLRDFYRFIRIDFLSHYGGEYYCPISILRVYGLTQLEEWKWDIWQAESRVKSERGAIPAVHVVSMDLSTLSTATPNGKSSPSAIELPTTTGVLQETESPSSTTAVADASLTSISPTATTQSSAQADFGETGALHSTIALGSSEASLPPNGSLQPLPPQDSSRSQISVESPSSTHTPSPASISLHTSIPESPKPYEPIVNSSLDADQQISNHSTINIPSSTVIPSPSSIPSTPTSSSVVQAPPPLPPAGESIYRMIMNRLTAVENNQTLYMKYVEQQNVAIRDMIRRLGEDIGRLEGITRAQGLALQRAVNDWEKQRYQLQMEYKDVLRRMEVLSHEIILEKRLGVAQLCLLLAVLIFLSLTRGSRANDPFAIGQPALRDTKTKRLKEWGRRNLSLTGDRKLSETTDQGGWKEGIKGQNRNPYQMRSKSDTKATIKRPKPLVLGPSDKNNILAYTDGADDAKLPFPTSEPPHATVGSSMNRRRTRTISYSRSGAGSGTTTPPYSAATSGNGNGNNRRMAFQRPVTPTSRSHFVFRTPQGRSHSFSRFITPIEGLVKGPIPLPMSQTSSWSEALGVVPKSAKNWARTAHLHDVQHMRKRQEQARIELARPERKSKRMGTDVDSGDDGDDDDVFLEKRPALLHPDDTVEVLSSQQCLLLGLGSDFKHHHKPSTDTSLVLPVGEETDLWVDTDSTSADDGNAEISSVVAGSPTQVVGTPHIES